MVVLQPSKLARSGSIPATRSKKRSLFKRIFVKKVVYIFSRIAYIRNITAGKDSTC